MILNSIKKLLALTLALVMIFSLTCGSFAYAMDDAYVRHYSLSNLLRICSVS